MGQNLQRRLRSLEIIDDLQTLADMGMQLTPPADENSSTMVDAYRHQARLGEFDNIGQFLDPQAVSVDIGANYGQYALKLAAGTRQCVVVEPNQALAWLAGALPPNCHFYNVAAGAGPGTAVLTIPVRQELPQFGLATLGDQYAGQEMVQQETPVRALDEMLAECCPDERVGFIKIDVEGAETAVLQGALHTLNRWRPNLQVEIWQENFKELEPMFAALAYRGLFFFDGRLFDIRRYDPAVHTAAQNAWQAHAPDAYDPTLYVKDFFFTSI